MKHTICSSLMGYLLIVAFLTGCRSVTTPAPRVRTAPLTAEARPLNPIAPPGVFIADPEVRVMPDGRVYVYGSRDEPGNDWCSPSYNVLSSDDMVSWHMEQTSFATQGLGKQTDYTENNLYAPDCIYHNGTYYLYYCLSGGGEGVATSASPYGPFRHGTPIKGIGSIDPSVFIDDDGQAYLYWAQQYAKGARLTPDMRAISGEIHDSLLTYNGHHFSEGSSMRKRGNTYYYVYAGHPRHGGANCATLCYATSASPLGPFTYRGVIIDNIESGNNLENNHGCIFERGGQWYVAYHRPTHGTSSMRKTCLEPITFNADGTIREAEMTTQGVGGPLSPHLRMDAARACGLHGNLQIRVRRPENDVPVEYLAAIHNNDYACWKYYDFDQAEARRFICKTWGRNHNAAIEIRLDSPNGRLLGTCRISAMRENLAYAIHETDIRLPRGIHALYLVFRGAEQTDLMNLEWFTFTALRT